jgi:hypothetical protein
MERTLHRRDGMTSPSPVRALLVTFALAAAALVGITVVALGQLTRPRPVVAPPAPAPLVTEPPRAPVFAPPSAPTRREGPIPTALARRRRDKTTTPAPSIATEVRRKTEACTNHSDPLCGLPLD